MLITLKLLSFKNNLVILRKYKFEPATNEKKNLQIFYKTKIFKLVFWSFSKHLSL